MEDGSTGILSAPTTVKVGPATYAIQYKTSHQPNGLAYDITNNNFYYCDEKSESIYAVNTITNTESVLKSDVKGADGLWLNTNNGYLYAGELYSKKIHVFDTNTMINNNPAYVQVYDGLNSLGFGSMLDDITVAHPGLSAPGTVDVLYGCDFLGKQVYSFDVAGTNIKAVDINTVTNGNLLLQMSD